MKLDKVFVILLQLVQINSSKVSNGCVCGHVQNEIDCKNSGFCFWRDNNCILNPGQTYNKQVDNSNSCKNFAEEDCREQKQCGFHLSQCIDFIECSVFNKNLCQESSYRCVSDGQKCIEVLECIDYKTEQGCQNRNQKGTYCIWVNEIENKCRDVQICEELPIYLTNHKMCKQGLKDCTVNQKGYGCMQLRELCSQYKNDFQCFESQQKQENCFWDEINNICFEKVCENFKFSQDYKCKQQLSECTSNGIHCIQRRECKDVKNRFGCVTDFQGNKCVYEKNECKKKSCQTAPDTLNNYQQCQEYDNFFDCVTSENGGCKTRPVSCDGYAGELDCYSIEQQNCVWFKNKCEYKQCHHASLKYRQTECKQYGNCIGKLNGGCRLTPQLCEEIQEQQFCELNYNKEKCIWLNGKCSLLQCNILKLPNYKNHETCQKASPFCTFNSDYQGCVDYVCENVQDEKYCKIDSNGVLCTVTQGCIDKECSTAPKSYNTNTRCELWLSKCTVNVQIVLNQRILSGCVDKKKDCQQALQEQCYSTSTQLKCKWDQNSQKCIDQICEDANLNIYSNDICRQFKVMLGSCIIRSTGNGCQQWPNSCDLLISHQQCNLNLENGTLCFWTGISCKTKECSDASQLMFTNNIECNTWGVDCIYNENSGGCMKRPNSVVCTQSSNNSMYDTHQECQAWNPKCTFISSFQGQGCEQKKQQCVEYIRQRNCKTTLNGQNCYWDDKTQKCHDEDNNNDGIPDCNNRIYGELTHQDCENFLYKCTIQQIKGYCSSLEYQCEYYYYEQSCLINRYLQPCKWDYQNKLCKEVACNDNFTAQTEAECLKFKQLNKCQLKINSNGTFGPGCENRPSSCSYITNRIICNQTLTQSNERCYYFNSQCSYVSQEQCEQITDSKSNQVCQLYNSICVLQSLGQGCYTLNNCSYLSSSICNSALIKYNKKCNFYIRCNEDNQCNQKHLSYGGCDGKKTGNGELCYYKTEYYQNSCVNYTQPKDLLFPSSKSLQDRTKLCQEYSSAYTYDTILGICVYITSCKQQLNDKIICNNSISGSLKCGFNFQLNICETRVCEHLTYANNYTNITDEICYEWKYNCVLDNAGCKGYSSDCTQIKLIQQCYQYSCFWQVDKCVNHIDCRINTTATTNLECLLINSQQCRLDYTKGQGCSFTSCSNIRNQIICNSTTLINGVKCIWTSSCYSVSCFSYQTQSQCQNSYGYYDSYVTQCFWCEHKNIQCSNQKYCSLDIITQPKSHTDCNHVNFLNTIYFVMNTKCTVKKQLCSQYLIQDACVITIDDVKCIWDSNLLKCINYCENLTQLITSNDDCFQQYPYCMQDHINGGCEPLNCSLLTPQTDCNIFYSKCFFDGNECKKISNCNQYPSTLCSNSANSKGVPCLWDIINTQCIEKTCQNKLTGPYSQSDCHNWLNNCQVNNSGTQCIEDCDSASNSLISHEECEQYYQNKSCTLKADLIQCTDLPVSCSLAQQNQCQLDKDGNQCYFQVQNNKCVNLTCQNLDATFMTHKGCNKKLNICTVNDLLNGCQNLKECKDYVNEEQCVVDQSNVECQWIISQNKCTIKQCQTAQLQKYSAYGCHKYFGNSCTVNVNLNGCELGQLECNKYTYKQCISDDQMNLSGIGCFWDVNKNICLERICKNGPLVVFSFYECFGFLSTCLKGGCRIKGYQACASIFKDKRCTTNGYQCILRSSCEDVVVQDGCTFDANNNICTWINDNCYTKTCQTASITLKSYEQCNQYLQYCTVKQDGGCTKKESCQNYLIKEACYVDDENRECIWDDQVNECYLNQCTDFCGDGIISSQEEQCDDGNYLPYDGCYKCQIQCPLGCIVCKGKLCEKCEQKGWTLINGTCSSICGDGYIVGKEQCDDANNDAYDGCYQCQYSCHLMCLNCFQGLCIQCEPGYNEQESQCIHVCGDGYQVQLEEQCDDGNLDNNDGCSNNCLIEQNWKCYPQNNISICVYSIIPKITLTKLSLINSGIQEFELSFSEPVRLNVAGISDEQFIQMIIVQIENLDNNQYDIEIKPILPISTQLNNVAYKILLNFKTSVSNPILIVTIKSTNIVNQQDNTFINNEVKLQLKSPNQISTQQQSLLLKAAFLTQIVLYIIYAVSIIAFLCGNLEILWNLLDMLQQLSYMKYHNIQFPQHLQTYFEIFDVASFAPITQYFQIDLFLQNIFQFQIPYLPAKWKFLQYQINCYFLENFETLLVLLTFGFAYYILSYFLYKLIIITKYFNWPTIGNHQQRPFFIKIAKVIYSIQKLARKYYQYFVYSGLIRIFISNFYELAFSSILQIINFNQKTTLNTIISYLALFTILFIISFLAFISSYLSKKYQVSKNLSVLVEGIKIQRNQRSKLYLAILLIKKILFIINLVVNQGLGAAQCLITAFLSGLFSCYIKVYEPFQNKFENIKIITIEILIMLNSIIFSIYEVIKFNQNKDPSEILGWVNVGGFTLILTCTLFIDIYQQIIKYWDSIITQIQIWLGIKKKIPKKSIYIFEMEFS
ncbi:unnamed protein product [Paramecium sonneborni]|uniref:Uncharacterized protein n=1 Tax=Paramecium sonneborni TaxID=65129 RepID=A0A8S1Q1U1_9CILI|nr:unnamed protein product [Paramecium sonneborni]